MSDWITSLHPAVVQLVTHAEPTLRHYGYPGVFVCIFFEGVGIPLPGQSLLMVGSLLAAEGEFRISLILLTALVAAIGGNCLGYWVGRQGGRALLSRVPFSQRRLERVERFFLHRGVLVVLLARFVEGFRQMVPIVAGSLKMPWWSFFGATVLGSLAWVGLWGGGVYFLSRDFHQTLAQLHQITRHGWWVAGALILFFIFWLRVRERSR